MSVFHALTKGKRIDEKPPMIDKLSTRHTYKKFEIKVVSYIRWIDNLVNGLTKLDDDGLL